MAPGGTWTVRTVKAKFCNCPRRVHMQLIESPSWNGPLTSPNGAEFPKPSPKNKFSNRSGKIMGANGINDGAMTVGPLGPDGPDGPDGPAGPDGPVAPLPAGPDGPVAPRG